DATCVGGSARYRLRRKVDGRIVDERVANEAEDYLNGFPRLPLFEKREMPWEGDYVLRVRFGLSTTEEAPPGEREKATVHTLDAAGSRRSFLLWYGRDGDIGAALKHFRPFLSETPVSF
ncbi:MAG TPA: hypothetical protein VFO31_00055, partial [Vicinamibacterales bacterium]|nr:hypothetical protein [Vicinamibacterales bacterium]